LEKFERISNKIVKVLARLTPHGSLLQRGAFTLSLSNVFTRHASVIFFARDFVSRFVRARKEFYSVLAPPNPCAENRTFSPLYCSWKDKENTAFDETLILLFANATKIL